MHRPILILILIALWLAPILGAAATAAAAGPGDGLPPHIVLYVADDHGRDFAGCYGNRDIRTPHLDALAREGLRLTRVFAASPTCSPSRAAMYTGLYPPRNGTMGNHTDSRPGLGALPGYLRALGYRVVVANKLDTRPPSVFDFEVLKATLPPNPANQRRYRNEGLDTHAVDQFLAAHRREHPEKRLCLVLGESGPHVNWEHNKTYDPNALGISPCMVDTPMTRAGLANYYQDITTVDQRVGAVLASLRKHGYADDTLFLYTSDQGPEWPHCKWTVYDTGLLVPMLALWPGKTARGSVSDALISLVDLTPTLIELAGGQPPGDLDGRSFAAVLLGRAATFRDRIYASHTGDGEMNKFPQRCVRDERYKYVFNLHPEVTWTTHFTLVPGIPESHKAIWDTWVAKAKDDPQAARLVAVIEHHPAEELYDTQADPFELTNRAGDAALRPVLERLRGDLARWMTAQGDPAASPGPAR